jgi:predicted amidohydrolase YtcJ
LHEAVKAAGTNIEPAHHAKARTTSEMAELLVEGRIATGNSAAPTAEAMAVSGGKIIALGSRADLEGLIGPSTKMLKPDGVVIPGLIEPHMHIWTSLLNLTWTDVSHEACATFDDVVKTMKAAAAKSKTRPAGVDQIAAAM